MEREAVESSQVVSVGYDSGAQALEVERAYTWTCLGTHRSNAEAVEFEKTVCRASMNLHGFTRIVPAVNHRWGVEVRDDKLREIRWGPGKSLIRRGVGDKVLIRSLGWRPDDDGGFAETLAVIEGAI